MDHNAENIWDMGLGNGLCQMIFKLIAVTEAVGTALQKRPSYERDCRCHTQSPNEIKLTEYLAFTL